MNSSQSWIRYAYAAVACIGLYIISFVILLRLFVNAHAFLPAVSIPQPMLSLESEFVEPSRETYLQNFEFMRDVFDWKQELTPQIPKNSLSPQDSQEGSREVQSEASIVISQEKPELMYELLGIITLNQKWVSVWKMNASIRVLSEGDWLCPDVKILKMSHHFVRLQILSEEREISIGEHLQAICN